MLWVLVLPFAILGGWISRMAGGGWPKLPFGLDQHLYAIPYAAVCYPIAGWWCAAAYVGAFLGKRTGHGGYIDLGTSEKVRHHRADIFLEALRGKIPEYWYDFIGLIITGIAVTLIPGLAVAVHSSLLWGSVLILSGALKAPAYAIGWRMDVFNKGPLDEPTAQGEFFTGFFGWGVLGIITYLLYY